jgi:hypothetical protein
VDRARRQRSRQYSLPSRLLQGYGEKLFFANKP